jgi:hypothetical protein
MARTSMIKAAAAAANRPDESNTKPKPAKPGSRWINEDKVAEINPSVIEEGRVQLPGFGRSVNDMPEQDGGSDWSSGSVIWLLNRLPNALQEWAPEPLTVRERNMMQVVNAITDKPDWRRKVFDKWRAEAVTEEGQGFTEKMFDYVSLHNLLSTAIQFADTTSALQSYRLRLASTKKTI